MSRTSTHRRLRAAVGATVAITVLGGASLAAGAAPGSPSHTSSRQC